MDVQIPFNLHATISLGVNVRRNRVGAPSLARDSRRYWIPSISTMTKPPQKWGLRQLSSAVWLPDGTVAGTHRSNLNHVNQQYSRT